MSFDQCLLADRQGRVQYAEATTLRLEGWRCDPLAEAPPFAFTDSTTVNEAAVEGARALTYAIFGGPPVDDADLVTRADDRDTARCQVAMLRRANALENAALQAINRVKRQALRDETVDRAGALEARLAAVFAANARLDRLQQRLAWEVDRKCDALPAPPGAVFPGACGDPDLGAVQACVIAVARCEACLKINAFDALNLDCDQADDQSANGSCP